MKLLRGLAIVFVVGGLLSGPARAGELESAFSELSNDGASFYADADYTLAIESWTAAYALRPVPTLLFHIAKAHQRDGQFERARLYFERFIDGGPDGANRKAAVRYVEMIDRHLARRAVERSLRSSPPARRARRAQPAIAAVETSSDVVVVDPRESKRKWFWRAAATTAVAVGATLYSGGRIAAAEDAKNEAWFRLVEERPAAVEGFVNVCAAAEDFDGGAAADLSSACNSGKRWESITSVMAMTSLVSLAASGYFYYKGYLASGPQREKLRIDPVVASDGLGVSLELDF